ncbi:hypothetical protein FJZ36_05705, partial [Candidatus Poribacteria bacterium]|nr:hypothetical protein [Candidatus Poribacteria bacterium]
MTFERAVARLLRQPEGARQPYLFVLDSSGLLGSLTELAVGCRRVPAITYHNDLQLRDSLEPYREQSDGPAPAVAVLFCRDPSGSRAIVDMARRARVVSVTPQAMLEAAGPDSDWHD